ncbi:MAG: DUF1048 domain-containing protein [Microcella pacifica]|uniref:DUF1048 domain-containing protein n=1 Tax=Microcella pacifica TaxID=2591847 RepID=UPI001DCB2204|nr:DUF1048 domain-containing protein [Actinomycetota bacterium]MBU1609874.1 DUF1048 domain-containing protein [Actinomycetota bacterium]MBU2315971.1 DUF1048 domain-containing protein [Actinomycetota bacterium]MBU2385149.1 DUF1048 domain-containing protein [Actinomycetota bacterium]
MAAAWIEMLTGSLDDKRRWRAYKTRKARLPRGYRLAIDGIERYLMYAGGVVKGDVLMQMLEDLADLIEGAAVEETPIRQIVGDEPSIFVDEFVQNYADAQWIAQERARLNASIDRAEAGDE